MDDLAFIPGDESDLASPLARFLPEIPIGIAVGFLKRHFGAHKPPGGSWILDPFGTSPGLAIEIAREGYRTLVAVNNPVTRFMIDMVACPPSTASIEL